MGYSRVNARECMWLPRPNKSLFHHKGAHNVGGGGADEGTVSVQDVFEGGIGQNCSISVVIAEFRKALDLQLMR